MLDGVGQSWAQAARLTRCVGFGATGVEVDAATRLSRDNFISDVFDSDASDPGVQQTPPPEFAPLPGLSARPTDDEVRARRRARAIQWRALLDWWLNRMVAVQRPARERITFAWHSIFATSIDKVQSAPLMLTQNETLRSGATGSFRALALSMLTDAAMAVWLDNQTNTKSAPNENLSREFMELFALGHGDGYTETDVREGARALSGWTFDQPTGALTLDPRRHDNGVKTVLGVKGRLDHVGFCDAVLSQRLSGPFVLERLWAQLVSDTPMDAATRSSAVSAYGSERDVAAAVGALLAGRGFDTAAGTRVIGPLEWSIGLARAVGAPPGGTTASALTAAVTALGQIPFHPPSVGGWPSGQAWLTAASTSARWSNARAIVALGDTTGLASIAQSGRLEAVAHLLGVATWSDTSAAALSSFASTPTELVAAAAMTPEYLTV